jgi:hypothetical protein
LLLFQELERIKYEECSSDSVSSSENTPQSWSPFVDLIGSEKTYLLFINPIYSIPLSSIVPICCFYRYFA